MPSVCVCPAIHQDRATARAQTGAKLCVARVLSTRDPVPCAKRAAGGGRVWWHQPLLVQGRAQKQSSGYFHHRLPERPGQRSLPFRPTGHMLVLRTRTFPGWHLGNVPQLRQDTYLPAYVQEFLFMRFATSGPPAMTLLGASLPMTWEF